MPKGSGNLGCGVVDVSPSGGDGKKGRCSQQKSALKRPSVVHDFLGRAPQGRCQREEARACGSAPPL